MKFPVPQIEPSPPLTSNHWLATFFLHSCCYSLAIKRNSIQSQLKPYKRKSIFFHPYCLQLTWLTRSRDGFSLPHPLWAVIQKGYLFLVGKCWYRWWGANILKPCHSSVHAWQLAPILLLRLGVSRPRVANFNEWELSMSRKTLHESAPHTNFAILCFQ